MINPSYRARDLRVCSLPVAGFLLLGRVDESVAKALGNVVDALEWKKEMERFVGISKRYLCYVETKLIDSIEVNRLISEM